MLINLRKTNSPPATGNALADALGRPLRDIRISLTDHCNLRCTNCMTKEAFGPDHAFLPNNRLLSFAEIATLAGALANLGLRKVKLTGGEPLTRPGLAKLVSLLTATLPTVEINLITNGILLAPLAASLRAAGLHRVTISLDSLDPEKFAAIIGRPGQLPKVLAGIAAAEAAGFSPVKINMVVIRGVNDDQVIPMADHFRRPGTILRFIEYMDVGTLNGWQRKAVVPSAEILARLRTRAELYPVDPAYRGETASRYRYADGSGEIGFISSVTQPFCGDCSRLRLSADGKLFTCLFSHHGLDIRPALASGGDELGRTLADLWRRRDDQYSAKRATAPGRDKIEMFYIGG